MPARRKGTTPTRAQSKGQPPLQVVIAEPLHVVRAGLELLVQGQKGFVLGGAAADSAGALAALKRLKTPVGAVLVVGLGLTGEKDAYALIRAARDQFPAAVVVACGANADKMAISRALFMGADGFVDKNASPDEFFDTLVRCANGEVVVEGLEGGSLGDIVDAIDLQKFSQPILTEREREVLQVASEGLTAREIAGRLGLRERTVTTHLGRIYGKLGVSTRVAAISAATRSGLVTTAQQE